MRDFAAKSFRFKSLRQRKRTTAMEVTSASAPTESPGFLGLSFHRELFRARKLGLWGTILGREALKPVREAGDLPPRGKELLAMAHRRLRRSVPVLVLIALLVAPWQLRAATGPAPPSVKAAAEKAVELFGRAWDGLVSLWAEEGCHIDPYRRCLDGQSTPVNQEDTDAGCHIDPYGACQPGG